MAQSRKAGKEPRDPVSPTELEVLKVLWERDRATVRELHLELGERGRSWAYTTVLTLLQRLESKGYVASEKEGIALVFRPAVSRDRLLRHRLRELAAELTGGAASPLLHALVEQERFTRDEIEGFRRLLDEIDRKKRKDRRGRPDRKKR